MLIINFLKSILVLDYKLINIIKNFISNYLILILDEISFILSYLIL